MSRFLMAVLLFLITPLAVHAQQPVITTVAGGGPDGVPAQSFALSRPSEVAFDSRGNFYIATAGTSQVFKIDTAGRLSLVAGVGVDGFGGDGGPARMARLRQPYGIAVDLVGHLYIADTYNHRIRRVDGRTGIITTIAGLGSQGFGGDGGPSSAALLAVPEDVALDAAGNLYIADRNNHRVRRIDASTGIITTVAGGGAGGDGGPATAASLPWPTGVSLDSAGNLFIASELANRVRRVDAVTGIITTVAGTGVAGTNGDGGLATNAELFQSHTMGHDPSGNLIIVESLHSDFQFGGNRLRKVDASTEIISTIAGGGIVFNNDNAPATCTALYMPKGLAIDAGGNIYFADQMLDRVRRVDAATGITRTAFGGAVGGLAGEGGPATSAAIGAPVGITVDVSGNLIISTAFAVWRVDAVTGIIKRIAGTGTSGTGGEGGPATGAGLSSAWGTALDSSGNLFIADGHRVRRVDAITGVITTIAGSTSWGFGGDGGPATAATFYGVRDVAFDMDENLYIADAVNNRIRKIDAQTGIITTYAGGGGGGDGGPATDAALALPEQIAFDADGDMYIADQANNRIRRVDASTGIITTVAGNGTQGYGGDGGPATSAMLNHPRGVAVDAAGNVYIGDFSSFRVRRVDGSTGTITTVAGDGTEGFSGDGGPAALARISRPGQVAIDLDGDLLIADQGNRRVRRVSEDAAAGSVPGGTLSAELTPSGDLTLWWERSCSPNDTDYEVYEGTLGDFTSHVPVTCTTSGGTGWTFTPAVTDSYYLIVPRNGFQEGAYGADSGGLLRLPGAGACLPQATGACGSWVSCGDSIAEIPEVCDGADLAGRTCPDLGYLSGTLACSPDCFSFDTSGCSSCGNGLRDSGEVCDGADLAGRSCQSLCFAGGTLACQADCGGFDTSSCVPTCGNGLVDGQEVCDGADLDGRSCASLGLGTGVLACQPECATFDISGCEYCGNDRQDGAEVCDGADLDGQTCISRGLTGGTLTCDISCSAFDLTGCDADCGDGILSGGEVCDGTELGGQTCQSQGFHGGTLGCGPTCTSYDTSSCSFCGNGVQEGSELCDGADLAGETCQSRGFTDGTLGCLASCTYDTLLCTTCGNNNWEWTEVCDGVDLAGHTCQSEGFATGTLACNPSCDSFDLSSCSTCGNGIREGAEQCDGSDLGGQTCESQGYSGGTLSCNPGACTFNFSQCWLP